MARAILVTRWERAENDGWVMSGEGMKCTELGEHESRWVGEDREEDCI